MPNEVGLYNITFSVFVPMWCVVWQACLHVVLCGLTVENDKLQQLLPNDRIEGLIYVEAVIYFISVHFFTLEVSSCSSIRFCLFYILILREHFSKTLKGKIIGKGERFLKD